METGTTKKTTKTTMDNSTSIPLTVAEAEDHNFLILHPLPGKIVLRPDPYPDKIGSIIVPDSAKARTERDICLSAIVVSVGYGPFLEGGERFPGITPEDCRPGDRVWFRLVGTDLNKRYVVSDVRRVDAVEARR
jgi:hypothetical protein